MLLDISTADNLKVKIFPETELEEIAQNVRTILKTVKGTVPLDRDFGISDKLIDYPIPVVKAKLTAEIAAAVMKYEPRARVVKVEYGGDAANGKLSPTVQIKIVEKNTRTKSG